MVAENKPVYEFQLRYAIGGRDMGAHKNQDPISIPFNTFDHLMALLLGNLGVHGVDWTTIYQAYS